LGILEQLGIDPKLILVNIIGFVILLAILKKFLYGPVTQALDGRAEDIRSTYAQADAEKARMEELRADYERRLADIEAEARRRIQAAIKEAQVSREHILNEAREQADKVISRGQEEIVREKEKAIVELRREVADLTINAAGKLIGRSLDEAGDKRLVEDFIKSIEAKG